MRWWIWGIIGWAVAGATLVLIMWLAAVSTNAVYDYRKKDDH